jgi:predicted nucleic acid-binding Zn ribbon protein
MHVPSKSLCLSHFCFRMVATGIVYVATDCYTCIIAHFSTKYSLYRVENGERSQVILIWYCIQKEFNFVLLYRSLNFFLKDIFWPLCCLFFFDIRILITSLVSFGHCVVCSSSIYGFWLPLWYLLTIVLSVLLRYTDSDYLPLVSFGHCVVCSSSIYGFWLPLWYLQTLLLRHFNHRCGGRRGRMVVGFTTTYAINAYYH